MTNRFLFVDGNNLTLRAMHASPDLKDSSGTRTGCVFISLRSLIRICDVLRPNFVFWFWDRGRSKQRLRLYPEYKYRGERSEADTVFFEEWKNQVKMLEEYLPYLGVGQIFLDGCEADDLMAFMAMDVFTTDPSRDEEVIIASSDNDFYQLIGSKVSVYNLSTPQSLIGIQEFQKMYSIPLNRWLFYRAMIGDSSDNIKGVAGIGPKRAEAIVKQFSSINDLEKNSQDLGKYETIVLDNKEIVRRNIELMDLRNSPLSVEEKRKTEEKCLEGLSVIPDVKKFWGVCSFHDMNKILEEKFLWKHVIGDKNGNCFSK